MRDFINGLFVALPMLAIMAGAVCIIIFRPWGI
jgi:hypothetical protein